MKLTLTKSQYEEAHTLLDKTRGEAVKLPRQILSSLLLDYNRLLAETRGEIAE